MLSQDFLEQLHEKIAIRRFNNFSVSMNQIRVEARRLDPQLLEDIPEEAFNHRMYRIMRKWGFSYRRGTTLSKTPQNTRHATDVIQEFARYFRFKMDLLGVTEDDVFNVDQTNLPFSLKAFYTWARRDSCSVAVATTDTSQRATVMLGTNLR
jgi:hypothetical protein